MKAINANISSMQTDINNLVVVDEQPDLEGNDNVHANNVDGADGGADAEKCDGASVASEASVDANVAHLLKSTRTSCEEEATSSRMSLLSSMVQDISASEMTGNAVQNNLANIVASLLKEKSY